MAERSAYNVPDDLGSERESVVVNPSAIGNPDETPRVFVGADLRRLLNPCPGGPEGWCGGVNGFHADTCTVGNDPSQAVRNG